MNAIAFAVKMSHTSAVSTYTTYDDAVAAIEAVFTAPSIGHSGDIQDGGERTLVWRDETSASNDDGSRAVAQIVKLHGDTSAAAGGVSL